MNSTIEHDASKQTFYCTINEKTSLVQYERLDTNPVTLDIYRTFVHPDMRGKGIAGLLLKTISEYAVSNGCVIQPSCSYAIVYYRKHREYASIVSKDADLENGGSCRIA